MTGFFWFDWPLLALSLANGILLLWLGLTVLLNAERRTPGVALLALSIPIEASFSTTAACCMILTSSAWMRATTAPGVPAGATMPCHWLVAKPAKPDSHTCPFGEVTPGEVLCLFFFFFFSLSFFGWQLLQQWCVCVCLSF